MQLDKVELYTQARIDEWRLYDASHNEKNKLPSANQFLASLSHYEGEVSKRIRDKLHKFDSAKDLASEIVRVSLVK